MQKKRHTAEQIIAKLREAEVAPTLARPLGRANPPLAAYHQAPATIREFFFADPTVLLRA